MKHDAAPVAAGRATLADRERVAPAGPGDTRRLGKPERERKQALLWRIGFLVAAVLLWEFLARLGVIDPRFASQPTAIAASAREIFTDPAVLGAIGETLVAVIAAFAIGTAIGMLVGVVLGFNRLLRDAYFPIVTVLLGIPKSVFLPIVVLFFGLGTGAGVAFASLLAFVHVAVNVVAGIDMVEKKYYDVARAYQANAWHRFTQVIVPGAAPGIFAGLWHGIRNGFVGVVIAQMFVSAAGIGYYVRVYSNNFQTDEAMALVLAAAILVIASGAGWGVLEARLTRWRS
ncbi:ABC transporter permease [Dactylosporangium sp. NPDC000555]|uniref:ABC transporter permease n=1 Tax=Dactylosporangium sp. NPDC000555 TaxID=3154260 RepID=UPI00332BE6CF